MRIFVQPFSKHFWKIFFNAQQGRWGVQEEHTDYHRTPGTFDFIHSNSQRKVARDPVDQQRACEIAQIKEIKVFSESLGRCFFLRILVLVMTQEFDVVKRSQL